MRRILGGFRPVMSLLLIAAAAASCSGSVPAAALQAATPAPSVQLYSYRIEAAHPHDPQAFTQGLFFHAGQLYESTGIEGRSEIRRVDLESGRVLQRAAVPDRRFGEGSVATGNQIISLTWKDGIGYRWDRESLRLLGSFRYSGEGWGLTRNATDVIMSDGTPELRFLDPETLIERRRLQVTYNGEPLIFLNEIEWVEGRIFANIWQTSLIAIIDPQSGAVTGWVDLSRLASEEQATPGADVLNGIAYNPESRRLYVTGKQWSRLYQIELVPLPAPASTR